jgi:aldose sugar dehydrogenase
MVLARCTISYPFSLYYEHGIRNSYGMDFDPSTNMLWDTENGPSFGDEVNLVEAGFNSGWKKIHEIWKLKGATYGNVKLDPEGLVGFQERGKFLAPEFKWFNAIGPTALVFFLDSDMLAKRYRNDIFVNDYHVRNIYHFGQRKILQSFLLEANFNFFLFPSYNVEYSYKLLQIGSKSMRVRWDAAENSDESRRISHAA